MQPEQSDSDVTISSEDGTSSQPSEVLPEGADKEEFFDEIVAVLKSSYYSGPIPKPIDLEGYENVKAGSAHRIISMAEKSLDHNITVKETELNAELSYRLTGMKYGFVSLSFLIIAALLALWMGSTLVASLFIGAGALGTVGKFIVGRQEKKAEE